MNDVFGFALYQGHYTPTNASQTGTPLQLTPPEAPPLPLLFGCHPQEYAKKIEFAPKSHLATLSDLPPPPWEGGIQAQNLSMQVNATTGRLFTDWQETTDIKEYFNGISTTNTTTTYTGAELSGGCCIGTALNGYWMMAPNSIVLTGFTCSSVSNANNTATESLSELYCNPHPFSVGSYTLVAEDLWNDTVYAYFQVLSTMQTGPSSNTGASWQAIMTMPVRYVLLIAVAVAIVVIAAMKTHPKIRRSSPHQNNDETPNSFIRR